MFVQIANLIQKNLTDDLLKPEYRRKKNRRPFEGHCYVATEAFYYLWGKNNGWKPYCNRDSRGTHWWLENNNTVLDLTADQFPRGYDYSKGHSQFFISHPSKRCMELVRRVYGDLKDR